MEMIINLFSIFDPSSSTFKINWIIPLRIFFFFLMSFQPARNIFVWKKIIWAIKKETTPILALKNLNSMELILISLFISIIILNLVRILPFTFTLNSHIVITFPTALIWWLRIMMYGWFKQRKTIIIHAIPTGTPVILINFIIIIEIVRNFIRPLTLSIRLRANMIAGHLLINLLGSIKTNLINICSILILIILEVAVSIIQAYVFIILLTLYSTEINYDKKKSSFSYSWNQPLTYYSISLKSVFNLRTNYYNT